MISETKEEIKEKDDKIFQDFEIRKDKEKIYNELEPYKFPIGAYSMYIRQCSSSCFF